MALATQCPHCQTTFRVAQDQLKLRAGLVRCGHCKEIFNGIEHLLPPTEAADPVMSAPSTPSIDGMPVAPFDTSSDSPAKDPAFAERPDERLAFPPDSVGSNDIAEEESGVKRIPSRSSEVDFDIPSAAPAETESQEITSSPEDPPSNDPLQRMTLMDFTRDLPDEFEPNQDNFPERELSNSEEGGSPISDPDKPDELDEAINELQRKPWRGARKKRSARIKADEDPLDAVDAEDEPNFVKRGRRRQRLGRPLRIVFGIGSCVLLIAALCQGTYLFRNQIAGFFPQFKPWLIQMCNVAGCRIDLPAQIASVSIESSELQTLAGAQNRFVLTTLLRNYSTTSQEWPYIELTLNDANEKPLLRRVFKPVDYVAQDNEMRSGFASGSERTVKLSFELSQIQASGYRVYLFYP